MAAGITFLGRGEVSKKCVHIIIMQWLIVAYEPAQLYISKSYYLSLKLRARSETISVCPANGSSKLQRDNPMEFDNHSHKTFQINIHPSTESQGSKNACRHMCTRTHAHTEGQTWAGYWHSGAHLQECIPHLQVLALHLPLAVSQRDIYFLLNIYPLAHNQWNVNTEVSSPNCISSNI